MKTYITPELSEKRRRAGRLGGYTTSARYGREHYVAMGKAGGRPSLPTLEEIQSQPCPRRVILPGIKRRRKGLSGNRLIRTMGAEIELRIKEQAGAEV